MNIISLYLSFALSLTILCLGACSTVNDEPDLPDTPQVEPPKPDNPGNGPSIFMWENLAGKSFSGNGQFLDRHYCSLISTVSRPVDYIIDYSRYSEHQFISILSASTLFLHARLSSGWLNVQYLPGCKKIGSVAVPRIVPVQSNITIDFEMKKFPVYKTQAMSGNFCDTNGNNVAGEIRIFRDGNFFGIERNFHINGFDLNPKSDEIYEKIRFGSYRRSSQAQTYRYENVKRIYYSFHGFKDNDKSQNFITSDWKSDKFESLSEGIITPSEFFSYITNLDYVDTDDYFSCETKDKTMSMDRVMATRFDEALFYLNTGCVEISGRYEKADKISTIEYNRLAINFAHSPKENECIFFINPEILLAGTTQKFIYDSFSQKDRNATLKDTSIDTEKVTFPMHTPKSYDWNAEMLLALSPYTANGLPMTYNITYDETGVQKRDFLTFSFADSDIAKKFVKGYLSILEEEENIIKLKECIQKDHTLDNTKKKVISKIVDNLDAILKEGTDFQASFNLFGIFDTDRICWD